MILRERRAAGASAQLKTSAQHGKGRTASMRVASSRVMPSRTLRNASGVMRSMLTFVSTALSRDQLSCSRLAPLSSSTSTACQRPWRAADCSALLSQQSTRAPASTRGPMNSARPRVAAMIKNCERAWLGAAAE